MNNSGLRPKGRAVLIKPYQPDIEQGKIIIPDAVKVGMQTVDQRAIVIDIGPECWLEERNPRARVGEKVLVSAFAGYMATGPKDKQQYRFVNDRDIFAGIED